MIRFKTFLFACSVMCFISEKGYSQNQQVFDSIAFYHSVLDYSNGQPSGIEFKIPKKQFDSPVLLTLSLLGNSDSVIFEKVVEKELLMAIATDTSNHFSMNSTEFIMLVTGIPAQIYKTRFQVIQQDGTVFFMVREEDWWEEGGAP